ncbi:hypothetical protein CBR_g3811 [Chara braunii]|uniref:Uncharacterized protein n=1 Tax=Chara braunii TaxID=69332 RepID=A0A388KGL1_CHABU|nr:hypothetical protein CBR_g3811 [Chara braunii]|eukprot:GBG69113.1 hypothetical protein CBR_g3811 [Chara braunii]
MTGLRQRTREETSAHFAVRITESAIDENEWYWFNIRDDVKYIVANYPVCAADKASIQPPRSIVPTVVEQLFQRVSMDTTDIVVPPGPNSLRPGHQELIAQELTIPVAQLADNLPLDIIAQDDEHLVPHVLSRTLTLYLQWSACVEGAAERIPPSQQQYLDPRTARGPAFFGYPTAEQFAAIREVEEEEESTRSDEGESTQEERGDSDEVLGEEDETPKEGSYSEHSEEEQSEEEEDEEEEEEHKDEPAGSEWEAVPEEALCTSTEAEDPEAARKREEIAARKKELQLASAASVQIHDDPNRDPEPPRPEDGDLAATTPTPSAR